MSLSFYMCFVRMNDDIVVMLLFKKMFVMVCFNVVVGYYLGWEVC